MTTFYENLIMVKWENFVHGDDAGGQKNLQVFYFIIP